MSKIKIRKSPKRRPAATKRPIDKTAAASTSHLSARPANGKRRRVQAAGATSETIIRRVYNTDHPRGFPPRPADTRWPAEIKPGKRHRQDYGDLTGLAASIDARGALLQPVVISPDNELIAGDRRLKAWTLTRFCAEPVPVRVVTIDSIIAGEWDENAQRKDFTPSEAVAIKREIEKQIGVLAQERMRAGKPAAPGAKGRAGDQAARIAGADRRTIERAEEVVEAAARDPERFADLVEQMDRTGKVSPAHKKMKVRAAKQAIEALPPAMPMNAKECATWVIDFPWAGEMERDQDKLDAAGRAFRPYPEMSIKTICRFAKDQIVPNLPEHVAIWLLVTNFILVRGYHLHVYGALGLAPEHAATMLTWGKDKIGRGKILRDQTEHAILLTRGKVTIDVFGEDPPSTLLLGPRRENSRKPDEFWRLVERVTPAKRYASIFSQGGEGENWDRHGDQIGKFAPMAAAAAEQELIAEARTNERGGTGIASAEGTGIASAEGTGAAPLAEQSTDPDGIPDFLRRQAPAASRAASLVNPRLLPGPQEIAAIAERAEAGAK